MADEQSTRSRMDVEEGKPYFWEGCDLTRGSCVSKMLIECPFASKSLCFRLRARAIALKWAGKMEMVLLEAVEAMKGQIKSDSGAWWPSNGDEADGCKVQALSRYARHGH